MTIVITVARPGCPIKQETFNFNEAAQARAAFKFLRRHYVSHGESVAMTVHATGAEAFDILKQMAEEEAIDENAG